MAVISTIVTVPAGVTSSGEVVVSGGILVVDSGGAIVGTIATQTGVTLIEPGGTASGTTVQGNILSSGDKTGLGGQAVEGVAISSLIASGGEEIAISSGVTSGTLVLSGGVEFLGGGGSGLAVGMTVNGGTAFVNSGGTASGTTVINGGVMTVASGGIDSHTSVGSGGTVNVSSGGTDSGTSVGSGGTFNVFAGGLVSGLTINDPNDPNVTAVANVLSGGIVDGTTRIDGGELVLDAGADFQANAKLFITNTGELVLEQDSFKGNIHDFGGQDFMDLSKIRFVGQGSAETTATFTQTGAARGLLQVAQGNHVIDLHLTGTYTTANFALQSDGAHGTTVTFVP